MVPFFCLLLAKEAELLSLKSTHMAGIGLPRATEPRVMMRRLNTFSMVSLAHTMPQNVTMVCLYVSFAQRIDWFFAARQKPSSHFQLQDQIVRMAFLYMEVLWQNKWKSNINRLLFWSGLFLSLCHIITIQCPSLVLPSRIKTPIFCKAERSRCTVRESTDKTTDICLLEMNGFSFINSHIFFCLSVSWTTDKLTTSLTTSLTTFFLPLVTS